MANYRSSTVCGIRSRSLTSSWILGDLRGQYLDPKVNMNKVHFWFSSGFQPIRMPYNYYVNRRVYYINTQKSVLCITLFKPMYAMTACTHAPLGLIHKPCTYGLLPCDFEFCLSETCFHRTRGNVSILIFS